jgi:hypothetical protein
MVWEYARGWGSGLDWVLECASDLDWDWVMVVGWLLVATLAVLLPVSFLTPQVPALPSRFPPAFFWLLHLPVTKLFVEPGKLPVGRLGPESGQALNLPALKYPSE